MKRDKTLPFWKSYLSLVKENKTDIIRILLALIFVSFVFIPLICMFAKADKADFVSVFTSEQFGKALVNSLVSTVISTFITIVLAYLAAVFMERTEIRLKKVFDGIFSVPMLIPSIAHGMGLIILFGNNGIFTRLFNLPAGIYGLTGIVVGSVLYAFPVAYLMIADIMKYEDFSPYEAAEILGIGKLRQFGAIATPYMRKPLISVVFAVFTLIITDYGVPLMIGGKYATIPVIMYQEVIGQLNFGKGAVYGMILLIPAVFAFLIDLLNRDKGNSDFVRREFPKNKEELRKVLGYTFGIVLSVFVMLPILAFIILGFAEDYPSKITFTLKHFINAINLRADQYWINSLSIAFLVAGIGTVIAFMTAYLTSRIKNKASRGLHVATITTAAIPGMVLGLAYVILFKKSILYGTLTILVIVNIVHFVASPYLVVYNSLSKINENLESVGHTLGIRRSHIIKDVIFPQCKNSILEMFSYFFVNCMMTISAVSFLANTSNKPISLMINQFEAQSQLECAAIVSLIILITNLIVKSITIFLKKK